MTDKRTAKQYIEDVISGKELVGHHVRCAVERHLTDLEQGQKRGIYFDEEAAQRPIDFFRFLTHSKGAFAGKPFELAPFQKFCLWVLFGWKNEDGTRRFKYAYKEIARKNGKTTFAAGLGLYMLVADGEQGAEIYTAATKRDQAKICFNEAKSMVQKSKGLKKYITVYQHNIHIQASSSKMEPLSSEHDTLDGLNPHCSIVDEYHAHKTAELYNVMKSAMGAREQPLQFTITTAGFNKESPCYKLRKTCIDILEGRKQDDTLFALIYTLDEGDDWTDPKNWNKANPNLGVALKEKYLKDECNQAQNNSSEIVNFLTKNLNIWTDASEVWIKDDDWMKGNIAVDPEALKGRECFGGLDLAVTRDITALILLFPNEEEETFDILPFFWVPADNARERAERDQVDYPTWIREGFIFDTPGNVTDYGFIKQTILDLAEKYQIRSIAYDRYNATQLVLELTDEGLEMAPFGQGFVSMSAPTKELEKLAMQGKLQHSGNPVLRWMCSNVELRRDPAGNIKIDKAKSTEKVDGMVALAMAIGEYLTLFSEETGSIYDDPNAWQNI
ncbi:terminase large subunit [Xanthovirga aplysinae]|uniref:terminase large subunit n=1 Tax=Xanthovirga aplysinae TaxID=2529853 RepID=UPI0012BC252C|nr:terminase TerL endonuclease subunit [Xanthovirga aplysinae]MTI32808.1 terminase large subunit [Xanthovirga aplysinae]